MKLILLSSTLLGLSQAQNAIVTGTQTYTFYDADGDEIPNVANSPIQDAADAAEIVENRKKYHGIYDPNMYPYGPLHGDYRSPDSDDAVSSPINLPSAFPLFDSGSTNSMAISSNGLVFLDSGVTTLDFTPEPMGANSFAGGMVAGFWSNVYSKRHGRIYWRLETMNTTLLNEMEQESKDGFPDIAGSIGNIQYAIIASWWEVTHFGAGRINDRNTFQIALWTDGTYSFAALNYRQMEWVQSPGDDFGRAGFDDGNGNFLDAVNSGTAQMADMGTSSTNSAVGGRHLFRLDFNYGSPIITTTTVAPITTTAPSGTAAPTDTIIENSCWPSNDNAAGGCLYEFTPSAPLGNGTCSITFPEEVQWFHVFDAHVRADIASVSSTWNICAANDAFEPGTDGKYSFIVYFTGEQFDTSAINLACDASDEFNFAVYSFPQNALEQQGRTNLRTKDNVWDSTRTYQISLGSQVANFTVDDPRITVTTANNMEFAISSVPDTIEEVWFQWEYISYFGSNEVGVM